MFLVGALFYICIIVTTVALSADLRVFIDLPSFIFILLSNIAILITTNSTKDLLYGIKLLISKNSEVDKDKLGDSIEVFNLLYKTSFVVGLIGVIIGLISMVSTLDEPSSMGIYISIVLLIPFYSGMINLIIISPARFMLSKMQGTLK